MPIPCRARCINQRNGKCQLEDERIRQSQVEFGEDWDHIQSCRDYVRRDNQEFTKRRQR